MMGEKDQTSNKTTWELGLKNKLSSISGSAAFSWLSFIQKEATKF